MPIRVLVVDDSGFFRRRVIEMLNADPRLEVVGGAANGAEAVEMNRQLKPDVITMDIEMPVMDGITAVRRILALGHVPILMFSSLTTDGAKPTLDALEAGALDYLPKRFEDISRDRDEARKALCDRVYGLGRKPGLSRPASLSVSPLATSTTARARTTVRQVEDITGTGVTRTSSSAARRSRQKLVAIGTSTGGPVALQQVLSKLPAEFPLPLLLIQHMPGSFTPAFAQRLDQQCAISVREAQDGDELRPGLALLAPGGKQMLLERRAGRDVVRISEGDPKQTYKPSVDLTFSSVAKVYPAETLAIVLTGMGADGREGARLLKQGGSTVWAQDEASCVVYGMPAAIVDAGLADQVLPLSEVGAVLSQRD